MQSEYHEPDAALQESMSKRHTIAVRLVEHLTLDDVERTKAAISGCASMPALIALSELGLEIQRYEYSQLDDDDKAECDRIDRERESARERQRRRREKGRAG